MEKFSFPASVATCGPAGYSPVAPGTMGAIIGVLDYLILFWLVGSAFYTHMIASVLILPLFFLGVWASNQVEAAWGHDPSKVVIDEFVGQWIALLWVPISWQTALAGFVLFRFFDILKPLFIKKLEALPHGWGVMSDDVLAGVYANIVLQGLIYYGVL